MKNLSGIFPPLATPFLENEIFSEKLKFNIEKYEEYDLTGYVVMGSNGESALLTRNEKIRLVSLVKSFAAENKIIIAGTGSDSIKETIELTNESADEGADFALVLTPSFYKSSMGHTAFIKYFTEIADAVRIPVIIYNVTKNTGVDIEFETVVQLSNHPNIIGIKNSNENIRQNTEIINNCADDFSLIIGTGSLLYSGLTIGAKGGILALANIVPEECISIYNSVIHNELNFALELQMKLLGLNKAVTSNYGISGLKSAMDMLGYFGGDVRSPLSNLPDIAKSDIQRILSEAGLL